MLGVIFAVIISIGLPISLLIYAIIKKRFLPFLLGVLAFIGSQILIRIPLLKYLEMNSINYSMFSAMYPVFFAIIIGLSAGVFEELARFVMMKFFMKNPNWQSGFLFGAGHGGIEAVLFVGISASTMLFSPTVAIYNAGFFIGGIERFFAMMLHIGLSIIVLQGVVQRKFIYVLIAILIHGFVDALVGILPLYLGAGASLVAIEVALALTAIAVLSYSLMIKRKEVFQ